MVLGMWGMWGGGGLGVGFFGDVGNVGWGGGLGVGFFGDVGFRVWRDVVQTRSTMQHGRDERALNHSLGPISPSPKDVPIMSNGKSQISRYQDGL